MDHTELVGKSDDRLKILAPDATHQHFKGGLYRFLGEVKDADTGDFIMGKDDLPRVAYMHCYPYQREIWIRDNIEFFGITNGRRRFRAINRG